uniref:Uncharacterized protein n=1 Tax=Avena sativa TaxID=4498 RepID=A0ACD5UBB6_AVESA
MAGPLIITGKAIAAMIRNVTGEIEELLAAAWKECPNCKHPICNSDVLSCWPGLPAGVKFDPTDLQLLGHLEEVGRAASHDMIDDYIPTIKEEDGICYTHPKNLPGVKMNGSSSYFFHRISNAYKFGQRKRRKVSKQNNTDSEELIRWQTTGKSKSISHNGVAKGWKKIMILKCDMGTKWIMHQCHLGVEKDEKHGELVVSKIFLQVKSNKTGKSQMHVSDIDIDSGSSTVEIDTITPNMDLPQPCHLSGSPFETEQNQDEDPGSTAVQLQAEDLAGNSQPVDYGASPDLYEDDHPLQNGTIHEKPVPLDYLGSDELPGLSVMDYNMCLGAPANFFSLTGSLNNWMYGNEA